MSSLNELPSFSITTSFEGSNAVLALHGRIENHAVFDLGAALDAAIELHRPSVRLDLANLEYIGSAGLVAVANAEKRFADVDIELTIQTPSTAVERLLAIMVTETDSLDRAGPESVQLGGEQSDALPLNPRETCSRLSSKRPSILSAVPADHDVLDAALLLIVELCLLSVRGADSVSVSLLRHGVLSTVAASDGIATEMDSDQYDTGEGPSIDASVSGRWFHLESLDTELRWSAFTSRSRSRGMKSILSLPLMAFEQPIGALNIYSRIPSTFDVMSQEEAQAYASKASAILSDARAGVTDAQLAERYQEAMRAREVIAMAKGILMERENAREDRAFTTLLHRSLDTNESLLSGAERVVLSTTPVECGF